MTKGRKQHPECKRVVPMSDAAKTASGNLKKVHGLNQRSLMTSAKTAVGGRSQVTTA